MNVFFRHSCPFLVYFLWYSVRIWIFFGFYWVFLKFFLSFSGIFSLISDQNPDSFSIFLNMHPNFWFCPYRIFPYFGLTFAKFRICSSIPDQNPDIFRFDWILFGIFYFFPPESLHIFSPDSLSLKYSPWYGWESWYFPNFKKIHIPESVELLFPDMDWLP